MTYATSDPDREHSLKAPKLAFWVRGRTPPLCEKWPSRAGILGLGYHSKPVSFRPLLAPPLLKASWVP